MLPSFAFDTYLHFLNTAKKKKKSQNSNYCKFKPSSLLFLPPTPFFLPSGNETST